MTALTPLQILQNKKVILQSQQAINVATKTSFEASNANEADMLTNELATVNSEIAALSPPTT